MWYTLTGKFFRNLELIHKTSVKEEAMPPLPLHLKEKEVLFNRVELYISCILSNNEKKMSDDRGKGYKKKSKVLKNGKSPYIVTNHSIILE